MRPAGDAVSVSTKALCVVIAATLLGCGSINKAFSKVERYHDEEAQVTCWIAYAPKSVSIACLPDSQVRQSGMTIKDNVLLSVPFAWEDVNADPD